MWTQSGIDIWANRYRVSEASWGTAELLESEAGAADYPEVIIDAHGTGIAVWQQDNGVRNNTWANRYE